MAPPSVHRMTAATITHLKDVAGSYSGGFSGSDTVRYWLLVIRC